MFVSSATSRQHHQRVAASRANNARNHGISISKQTREKRLKYLAANAGVSTRGAISMFGGSVKRRHTQRQSKWLSGMADRAGIVIKRACRGARNRDRHHGALIAKLAVSKHRRRDMA